jgi:hypothetical protein
MGGAIGHYCFFMVAGTLFFSVSSSGSFNPKPINGKLFGFRILFACFGQEKNLLCLSGTEPRLLGFLFLPQQLSRDHVTLTNELRWCFSNMLNFSVDTQCQHPKYPSPTRSSNVHRVWLCDVAVRKVTVVLVLQAATQQNSIFFQSKMSK